MSRHCMTMWPILVMRNGMPWGRVIALSRCGSNALAMNCSIAKRRRAVPAEDNLAEPALSCESLPRLESEHRLQHAKRGDEDAGGLLLAQRPAAEPGAGRRHPRRRAWHAADDVRTLGGGGTRTTKPAPLDCPRPARRAGVSRWSNSWLR